MRIRLSPSLAEYLDTALTWYFTQRLAVDLGLKDTDREGWRFLNRLRCRRMGRPDDPPTCAFWDTKEGQARALAWLRKEPRWYDARA